MSRVTSPPEKKRLAYERDHYAKGKHDKGWRQARRVRKTHARRAFRKASNDLLRVCAETLAESNPTNAQRKQAGLRQRKVLVWGACTLREFVATRRLRNRLNLGARQARRQRAAERAAAVPPGT